jgi:hypothetical protein
MLQFFAGLLYELIRLFAALTGLAAMANGFIGLIRHNQDLFERGLFLGIIALALAVLARSLRRFEL